MEPKIQQIISMENKICGLGTDNKMYRWDYGKGEWVPNWNTAGEDVKTSAPTVSPI
jgi:hypothetical protein